MVLVFRRDWLGRLEIFRHVSGIVHAFGYRHPEMAPHHICDVFVDGARMRLLFNDTQDRQDFEDLTGGLLDLARQFVDSDFPHI